MAQKTKLRQAWKDMQRRCYSPDVKNWHRYGGRGIMVCDEWRNSFEVFQSWSWHNGFDYNLTLDRIDVNGNYEPSNCRWVTIKVQANNTSTNKYIEHNGERLSLEEWGNRLGACKGFIWARLKMGWNEIDAITIPKKRQGNDKYLLTKATYNGETLTYMEWSRKLGG